MAEGMSQERERPIRYRRTGMDNLASIPRSRGASNQAVQDMIDAYAAQDAGIYDADSAIAKIAPTDLVPDRAHPPRPKGDLPSGPPRNEKCRFSGTHRAG
jgi:hypothetical protein